MTPNSIPKRFKAFAESTRTRLVQVVGNPKKDLTTDGGIVGDEFRFYIRESRQAFVWRWGDSEATSVAPRGEGALCAIRPDGLEATFEVRGQDTIVGWRDGREVGHVAVDSGMMECAATFAHGFLCVTNGVEGVVVYDLEKSERLRALLPPASPPRMGPTRSLIEQADGRIVVGQDETIHWFDVRSGRELRHASAGEVHVLAGSAEGRFLAAPRTHVHVLDGETGRELEVLENHSHGAEVGFVTSGTDGYLVTMDYESKLRLFSVPEFALVDELNLKSASDNAYAIHPWNAHGAFVVVGRKGLSYVFEIRSSRAAPTHGSRA